MRTMRVIVTAYSSSTRETDATPFITASGTHVRDGVVACNTGPFGMRVLLPQLFKGKLFTIEDRMSDDYEKHPRNRTGLDIWMADSVAAKNFGVDTVEAVIIDTVGVIGG